MVAIRILILPQQPLQEECLENTDWEVDLVEVLEEAEVSLENQED